jgi:2-dehydropantoate 2-reductase
MRFLVVGAGAVGGYFGGRLLQAGRDVTFLVRPARAAKLAQTGLAIQSRFGDTSLPSPPTVTADKLRDPFDVVLIACKAYDLEAAIQDFAPAVSSNTSVIPLLNGMRHLDALDAKLGEEHVLGGVSLISARLDDTGRIVHIGDTHRIVFGDRKPRSTRAEEIAAAMAGALFECRASKDIILEMWEKWVFLATLAGATCLMRAAVCDIVGAAGTGFLNGLFEECRTIATAAGQSPRAEFLKRAVSVLHDPVSPITASMLADLERGGPTEADHILGDLLSRRPVVQPGETSLLQIAYIALKASAARALREKKAGTKSNVDESSLK